MAELALECYVIGCSWRVARVFALEGKTEDIVLMPTTGSRKFIPYCEQHAVYKRRSFLKGREFLEISLDAWLPS